LAKTRTEISVAKYRKHAARYDSTTHRTEPLRKRTIAHLRLRTGDVVLDVACGTGLSFALIQKEIGPTGKLIGIEQCPEMMERARLRATAGGWENVLLIESPVEASAIPLLVDAVLFNFTHDVLRSRAALEKIFHGTRAGARVAAAGMKLLSWWLAPANLYIMLKAYPYMTTFEGLNRPWSLLQEYVPDLQIEPVFWGGAYLAFGTHARPGVVWSSK
jgi:demethylmenaquinone methyltransferase/2-methoxy-6-polyprenyl-1,4-benzoquinol methylase